MAEPIPDLIPDVFHPEAEESPVTILRAQADRLGEKTDNVVLGEVVTLPIEKRGRRGFGLNLVVPALDDYRYQIFWLSYHPAETYPLQAGGPCYRDGEEFYIADNRAQYLTFLRNYFGSPEFAKTVSSLIREASAVGPVR